MPLTTVNPGLLDTQAQYTGFKNRIINGAMIINQRAAASYGNGYNLDRWAFSDNSEGNMSVSQSTDAPAGFINSLRAIVNIPDANPQSGQMTLITQMIEGLNVADLGWGTANAQPVTLSFRAKSSIIGTYNYTVRNSNGTRNYVGTFAISSANTWETISVTIPGDTTGTWLTTNGIGIYLGIVLTSGSGRKTTANVWGTSATPFGTTGSVNWISTSGATFFLTGVQLEKGSTATSFDYRPYELALCQRYYFQQVLSSTQTWGYGHAQTTNTVRMTTQSPVPMRASPSFSSDAINIANYVGSNGTTIVTGGPTMTSISTIDYTSTNITLQATATGIQGVSNAYGYGGVNRYSSEL